jgi:hypothetical protein
MASMNQWRLVPARDELRARLGLWNRLVPTALGITPGNPWYGESITQAAPVGTGQPLGGGASADERARIIARLKAGG